MTGRGGVGDLRIVPATPDRWDDVRAVFGTRGDPSWCWCQFFVTTGRGYEQSPQRNREALRCQLDAEVPPGLLAYVGAEPVGWLQVGPRVTFPRVTTNRDTAGFDSAGVWRCTCFVVRVGHRRRGIASALLEGAVTFAREQGAEVLEGHPVDVGARGGGSSSASLYHGTASMFARAGFRELLRTRPDRPVMRRALR